MARAPVPPSEAGVREWPFARPSLGWNYRLVEPLEELSPSSGRSTPVRVGPPSDELAKALVKHVDNTMGPIARPERIIFANELPKTRSGKIMRRILKALVMNEPIGNTMTLLNPESVEELKQRVGYKGPD